MLKLLVRAKEVALTEPCEIKKKMFCMDFFKIVLRFMLCFNKIYLGDDMKETEITVQVFNNFEDIDKKLKLQGFKMIENYQVNDWYFSIFKDISNLNYLDLLNNSFLVREIIDDKREIHLCYKRKELDCHGNVISEEKIRAKLDSLENSILIFKNAGLNNYCKLRNNSFVYQKDDICFVVQIMDNLGIFIEYEEDDSMSNMTAEEKFDYMCKIVNTLGLNLGNDYSCKKVFMMLKK